MTAEARKRKAPYRQHELIAGALRKIWMWSPARQDALRRAKCPWPQAWVCSSCERVTAKPQVDHVVPVGEVPGRPGATTDWNGYMERLFCPTEGLSVLCAPCHVKKTAADRARSAP